MIVVWKEESVISVIRSLDKQLKANLCEIRKNPTLPKCFLPLSPEAFLFFLFL